MKADGVFVYVIISDAVKACGICNQNKVIVKQTLFKAFKGVDFL